MSDRKDKEEAKAESVDVSGYMPGGSQPQAPGYAGECKGPEEYSMEMNTLEKKLKCLVGQEVTVYIACMGTTVTTVATAVPFAGAFALTGMLKEVGCDYLELHVLADTMRVVYVPMMAVSVILPGGPLVPGTITAPITINPAPI